MRGPELLIASEGCWTTAMGAWFPGERAVLRGKDLFQDFQGLPWMGLLLYGITGRIPDDKQIRLFEGMWSLCTSYPDPRLWNNRVAALAGTARSTATLGVAAATAISEATIYGHRPLMITMDFLLRIKTRLGAGADLRNALAEETGMAWTQLGAAATEKSTKTTVVPGYGRPVTPQDERIAPLRRLAEELGYAEGPVTRLTFDIEAALQDSGKTVRMNIAALMAGLAADQGLTPHEFYCYTILCFSAGMVPSHLDALQKPEGTLYPLRCEHIAYSGTSRRQWNDA